MNAVDDSLSSQGRPTGIGPGERLQAARIQKGMSLEDVASRMHLSTGILEAIEENNFDEITAPIFVKGYLRAYARIVELDEDEMIEQYMQYYSNEDPPISSTSNMAPELSVADARIKWTTYLVVVVLAALLIAWWWNKEQNQEAPISLDAQGEQTEAAATVSSGVTSEIEAVSEAPPAEVEAASETADATAVAQSEPAPEPAAVVSESVEPAAIEPAVVEPADPEPAVVGPAGIEPEAGPPQLAAAGAESESAAGGPNLLAPTGSDKLEITVHADTWADIKDATDYQLVYDLLRAEQKLEITGSAPFAVFLGNGHGVEIRFNGEEINFSPRIRSDNTARLKVGG